MMFEYLFTVVHTMHERVKHWSTFSEHFKWVIWGELIITNGNQALHGLILAESEQQKTESD